MTDGTENLVLDLRLRRAALDQHTREFADIKLRLGGMDQHIAGFVISEVRQNSELDNIRTRLDRIDKRLDLVDE